MSNDDKVVHAFPGTQLPENPMQVDKVSDAARYCQHATVRLSIEERVVYCAKCNTALDPFNFLLTNAKTIQRAWEAHAQATNALNALNERVASLKAEEGRIKARIKRQQEKAGPVLDIRGKSNL